MSLVNSNKFLAAINPLSANTIRFKENNNYNRRDRLSRLPTVALMLKPQVDEKYKLVMGQRQKAKAILADSHQDKSNAKFIMNNYSNNNNKTPLKVLITRTQAWRMLRELLVQVKVDDALLASVHSKMVVSWADGIPRLRLAAKDAKSTTQSAVKTLVIIRLWSKIWLCVTSTLLARKLKRFAFTQAMRSVWDSQAKSST